MIRHPYPKTSGFGLRWVRLFFLHRELRRLELLDRKHRDVSGKTTVLTADKMVEIGQRMAEVRWKISQLQERKV